MWNKQKSEQRRGSFRYTKNHSEINTLSMQSYEVFLRDLIKWGVDKSCMTTLEQVQYANEIQ